MKKFLIIPILLLASAAHGQALFQLQKAQSSGPVFTPGVTAVSGSCNTGGASCTSSAQSVTAGQFAVACIGSGTTSAVSFSVSDTNSDVFVPWAGGIIVGTSGSVECWIATMSTTNASEVFTFTNTAAEPFMTGVDAIYTGTPTSGWDVTPAGASSSGTCPYTTTTGTSATTANASELGIAAFMVPTGGSITLTGIGSWTVRVSLAGTGATLGIADNVLSSKQTLTATATVGGSCAGQASLGVVSSIK
jgi:hypothetical protein